MKYIKITIALAIILLILSPFYDNIVQGKDDMTKEVIFHTKNGQYKIDIYNPSEKDKEDTGMKNEDFERIIEEVGTSLEERVKKLEMKAGN